MALALIVIAVLIIGLVIAIIASYNELVTLRQRVKNGFSQIDVQLQKRFDLIPNLVETVKGYAQHEAETLENVTKLRSAWTNTTDIGEKAKIDGEITRAIGSIYAVAEKYPELRANENFMNLQSQLKEVEEKIAYARQFYNDVVTKYNTKIQLFPSSIITGMFHFESEKLFEVDHEEARQNVKVDFSK